MKKDNDIGFMGSVARDFMSAASRSYMGFTRDGRQLPTIPIPVVVCYAFAAEVHFKVILEALGQKNARGHNLRRLYVSLPRNIRVEIEHHIEVKGPEFLVELGRVAEAFVDWRYIYEGQKTLSLNLIFLGQLAAAIQKVAMRLSPPPPPVYESVTFAGK